MKIARSASEEGLEGQYEAGFIGRVYRTALVVWAFAAAILYSHFGTSAVVGLSIGVAVALGSLRTIEWTVRQLLRPERSVEARQFALISFFKLPLLTGVMAVAAWAVISGAANVFALVGGVALVHGVIVLKAIGGALVASRDRKEAPGFWPARAPRGAAERAAAAPAGNGSGPRSTPPHPKWGEGHPVTD